MPIKSKCENCKFYKAHKFYAEKGVENIGGTCEILDKTTKSVVNNEVVTFDIERQCPLERISNYDKLRDSWNKLAKYVAKLEVENEKLNNECQKVLLDIMIKMKSLEKGE